MKFIVVIMASFCMLCAFNASADKTTPTCQDDCSTTWSKPYSACKEVVECHDYVKHQYEICLQTCRQPKVAYAQLY
jgi:hypothetical protein